MVNHVCDICQYSTINKSNYNKHLKSKRHLKNSAHIYPKNSKSKTSTFLGDKVPQSAQRNSAKLSEIEKKSKKERFLCQYCGLDFKRSYNVNRHLKVCNMKNDVLGKEALKQQLVEKDRIIKEKEKQLKEQKIEKEYYKKLIDNYSKLGPKTFNSITYVMNRYADAPHIKKIEPEQIEYFQDINMTKVENMVSDYRNDRFVHFVINTIASIHKKDNPEDQSIWSTDSSRYNYVIKELLENEGSYWVIDKKGTKSKDYLVEPILKFIRKEIVKYNELASEALMNENLPKSRFSIITDTQRDGIDIIKDIDDGILSAEIIRKMAKHFHHKTKESVPLIEEIE